MRQYIGVPYKHLGRDKNGLDCYGLVVLIYRDKLGVQLPDVCEYEYGEAACKYMKAFYTDDQYEHVADFHRLWEQVDLDKLEKYDVILFSVYEDVSAPTHSGVYLGRGKFIHVMHNLPVTISSVGRMRGIHSAYRYKERSDINDNS